MAISSTDITAGPYSTNAATTQFSFSFRVEDYGDVEAEDMVKVVLVTIATGAETILTRGVSAGQYTVTVNADQDSSPGGSITTISTYAAGYYIYVRLKPTFKQATELQNQGAYNADVVEAQFDEFQRQILDLKDQVRRSPVLGVQIGESFDGEITGAAQPGYIAVPNAGLTGFEWVANNGSSNLVTATGSITARTLADRFSDAYRPEDFGAVGDGVADDTAAFTAILALFDDGDAIELKPGATYLVDGLILPHTNDAFARNGIYCPGGVATIKKRSSSNTAYLVAFSRWDTNAAFANNPWRFENVVFDGNSLCEWTIINRSYQSLTTFCVITGGTLGQVLHTRYAKDGVTLSDSYLSDVHWVQCIIRGGSTSVFKTTGDPTDGIIEGCVLNGLDASPYCFDISNFGGWSFENNQTFRSTSYDGYIRDMGQDGVFAGNHVGGKMLRIGALGSNYGPHKIGPMNIFWLGITVDFTADSSTEVLVIEGNDFRRDGSATKAYIEHNNDAASKIIISRNNDFETDNPHRLGSGKTLGAYIVQGGYSADATEHRLRHDIPNLFGFRNRLMNGAFRINQRGAATNADDTYSHDRWYVLTQTDTVAVSSPSNPENGQAQCARLTQSQASAQRMGYAQIIETANCRDLRGGAVTFRGRVRLSTTADVRYAILEWTGTGDTVTSDVVNDWTSSTYTGGNFFNSTTLNVLKVGEVACTANTWRDLDAITASVGSSANNLIVMVWTEGTAAQNVTLDLGRMQLERGYSASDFEVRPFSVELELCKRYYVKSFGVDVAPAQSVAGNTEHFFTAHTAGANTNRSGTVAFPVEMRAAPTVTLYNPAASNAEIRDANAAADCSSSAATAATAKGFRVTCVANASTAVGNLLSFQWSAAAEL